MSQTRENFNSTNLSYIGPISKYFITQKLASLNFYDETERKANHLQNYLYNNIRFLIAKRRKISR